ncbi:MAG: Metallopeptidase [Labilithrix sp.]|nr:Metallopeptidase [Labilithrix sp.]
MRFGHRTSVVLIVTLAAMIAGACSPADTSPAPRVATPTAAASSVSATGAAVPQTGVLRSGMDTSVPPGADFYRYANGAWLASTEIPKDRSAWGVGAQLDELTNERTARLIREVGEGAGASAAAAGAKPSTDARLVGDYFAAFMDEAAIEAKGLAPLDKKLAAIAAIKDKSALSRALGGTVRADVDVLNATELHTDNALGLWVAQDLDDPTRYAAFLLQGGLGMPDRDYYVDASPRMTELRTKYQAHVAAILELAHVKDSAAKAARIVELEKRIAQTHSSREDAGDVEKGNNHWSRRDLDAKAPGLDWNAFLGAAGLDKQTAFVAWTPKALTGLAALVKSEPLDVWKDYLAFHAIDRASPFLPKAFVAEGFAFYGTAVNGTEQLRERWKRGVEATNNALGEAVGKLYVDRHFPPSEKARAQDMVKNLVAAFGKRIDSLTWMSPTTKTRAKAKLASLDVGVGYPDRFRDYSGLEVVRGDALGNSERAELFELRRNLKKLGMPIDRGEWVMTPQTVNAVNLPVRNALQFPAAILQPPMFDKTRSAAANYGAIGAIIGHEISHSFDDQGALFDATGKLSNWWTADDLAHFKASGAALAKQYDAYKPFPDASVNGKQTLGENIADVAGLSAAFDAYQLSLDGKPAPQVEGFTGEQQFFLGFAQSWRTKMREAKARSRLVTDGHAPAEYRADTVRNLDAWYAAFDPKPGQALFLAPAERVRVW